jgi:hypothetical protein
MLLATLGAVQQAGAYSIDGDLKDWLKGAPTGSADDWQGRGGVKWTSEDQNSSYLDPGYGGQDYDAEALYVDLFDGDLHIAIVTGRAPGTNQSYPGGDIAINLSWAGGSDSSFELGIVTQDHDGFVAGDVVEVDEWRYGLWTGPAQYNPSGDSVYKKAHPVAVKGGTKKGSARLIYTEGTYDGVSLKDKIGPYDGEHYVIEAMLDLNEMGLNLGSDPFLVHWTEWCANDWIQVDPPKQIPTPPAVVMLGLGLALLRLRRRTR